LCFGSDFLVSFEIDDLGVHRGNMVQVLTRCRHPVASNEALDVIHQAMCSVLYRHICMATKISGNGGIFVVIAASFV
jgi:hypothetical protein